MLQTLKKQMSSENTDELVDIIDIIDIHICIYVYGTAADDVWWCPITTPVSWHSGQSTEVVVEKKGRWAV